MKSQTCWTASHSARVSVLVIASTWSGVQPCPSSRRCLLPSLPRFSATASRSPRDNDALISGMCRLHPSARGCVDLWDLCRSSMLRLGHVASFRWTY